MVAAFKSLVGDENIIKEFDLKNPENILKQTIDSIKETVDKRLATLSGPPRRYLVKFVEYCGRDSYCK